MTTNDFAKQMGILGPSIHRRVCLTGSYYGVTPTKLPNGRLDWPNDGREQLISQAEQSAQRQANLGAALKRMADRAASVSASKRAERAERATLAAGGAK